MLAPLLLTGVVVGGLYWWLVSERDREPETFRGRSGRTYSLAHGEQGAGGRVVSVFAQGRLLFTFVELPNGSRSLTARNPDANADDVNVAIRDLDLA